MKVIIYIKIFLIKLMYKDYWFLPTSLIYAQAKHETGDFKSIVYQANKNLFGMRGGNSRPYDDKRGIINNHAAYVSELDSIKDYFDRQKQFNIQYKNNEQYINDTIKSKYAEDLLYSQKWRNIYNNRGFKNYIDIAVVPGVIIITYLLYIKVLRK